ncbi:U3 small nucleolar RNA-interacting protein 2-like isoform X1 [Daphnia carinata]|uniref:U3 small nucleolar RNA-interacting protein 2-like isoform X1 n=1 Tax=Daphnia carinata TaxID=120202 RepID=UPI002580157B|nr:U3 small nucleolar RNA-interacting protein 2-like isoform X1 [Daphnia carinata]
MSFFIRKNQRGAKRSNGATVTGRPKTYKEKKRLAHDDEISSHSEGENDDSRVYTESEEDEETVQEKRLRLTKEYIQEIENQERIRREEHDIDKSVIAHRLKEDLLEQSGRLRRTVADSYEKVNEALIRHLHCKDHKQPITCLTISPDCQSLFTASKDCTIVKWCLVDFKKVAVIKRVDKKTSSEVKGHKSVVQSLSISSDGKFLASGDLDNQIHIWDSITMKWMHTFRGHRDGITGLVFRRGTHTLYSASMDRTVKIWNLDEMSYVETLLGHQDAITSIDALNKERAITAGGRDNSLRVWKIPEESQLIFNGHQGSIDCVRLINEDHFVSCGDDGMLSLWGSQKKKPLCSVSVAHGVDASNNQAFWISSVAALTNTDLIASAGSQDGFIRLWKCGENFRSLTPLFSVPVCGFVNSLAFSSDGKMLIAGLGQEHRLGRWWRNGSAKNEIVIIPLKQRETS